jgi:hypothetical protein
MRPSTYFPLMVSRWLHTLTELASGGENVSEELAQSARIILLLNEGLTVKEVAAHLGLSQTRVIVLRKRFIILGLPGLQKPAPRVYGSYLRASRPDESSGMRAYPRPKKRR